MAQYRERRQLSTSRPVRVLQVLPALGAGGVETDVWELSAFLKKQPGVELFLASNSPFQADFPCKKAGYIQLPLKHKNPFTFLYNAYCLSRFITQNSITLIHAHSRAPAWSCYLSHVLGGIPLVTTYHALYGHKNVFKRLYNSVMLRGDATIAISHTIQSHIQAVYARKSCFHEKKLYLIQRGINVDFFSKSMPTKPLPADTHPFLQKCDKKTRILLVPGRPSPVKGQLQLLKALNALNIQKKYQNLRVVLLGAQQVGTYAETLQAYIKQHNMTSSVFLEPTTKDPRPFYKAAHMVVVPTQKPEGFGRVIAEAGAMSLPVLAFDEGGASEIIVSQKTGILVPRHNLKDGLQALLSLSDRARSALGENAAKRIKSYFCEALCHQKTLKLYATVMHQASSRKRVA